MKVALMQPTFMPWLGYFGYIAQVERFVFFDDAGTSRQSWQQRNRLFVAAERVDWITVPIRTSGNFAAPLDAMPVVEDRRWRRKLESQITQTYARAPHAAALFDVVRPWLGGAQETLAALNIDLIERLTARFGLGGPFLRSSSYAVQGLERSARVVALLKAAGATAFLAAPGSFGYMREDGVFPAGLEVAFQQFTPVPYPQHHAQAFVSHLSVLDAVANVGFEATAALIRQGIRPPIPWDDMAGTQVAATPDE